MFLISYINCFVYKNIVMDMSLVSTQHASKSSAQVIYKGCKILTYVFPGFEGILWL